MLGALLGGLGAITQGLGGAVKQGATFADGKPMGIANALGEGLEAAGGTLRAGGEAAGEAFANIAASFDLRSLGHGIMGGTSFSAPSPEAISKPLVQNVKAFTPTTEFCHDPAERLTPLPTPVCGPSSGGLGI